jgi:hypothetical protein
MVVVVIMMVTTVVVWTTPGAMMMVMMSLDRMALTMVVMSASVSCLRKRCAEHQNCNDSQYYHLFHFSISFFVMVDLGREAGVLLFIVVIYM